MDKRLTSPLIVGSAAAIALCLATGSGLAGSSTTPHGVTLAQGDKNVVEPDPEEGGPGASVLKPKQYPETPAEVAECVKSWDPQTGMSREEYEESCKRTLKYFPEGP